jgi:hypothetical protein
LNAVPEFPASKRNRRLGYFVMGLLLALVLVWVLFP